MPDLPGNRRNLIESSSDTISLEGKKETYSQFVRVGDAQARLFPHENKELNVTQHPDERPRQMQHEKKNLRRNPQRVEKIDHNVTDGDNEKLYYVDGRFLKLSEKDYEPFEQDSKEYFREIYRDYQERHQHYHERHRRLESFQENYDDVYYWVRVVIFACFCFTGAFFSPSLSPLQAYEWMLKVGTEYYFRYEGTQVVPPCRQVVHWRVMKDPIRVHERQIAELNRLLAWRINEDTCTAETAGVLSEDGNKVNVNREIQYTHRNHRKVFCECKDWPSQFLNDQIWCTDWENDPNYNRFYAYPYSFPTYDWLPGQPNPYISTPPPT